VAAIAEQRASVRPDQRVERAAQLLRHLGRDHVGERDDQRRVAHDLAFAVDDVRELLEGLHAVAGPRLGDDALDGAHVLLLHHLAQPRQAFLHLCPGVPDLQVRLRRELRHRGPIAADRREHGLPLLLVGERVAATRDHDARREALDIPFPRCGQRLVEVVDVEQQRALGRGEQTEVRDVRVAARLHADAGRR
jgi:hypothetical protein